MMGPQDFGEEKAALVIARLLASLEVLQVRLEAAFLQFQTGKEGGRHGALEAVRAATDFLATFEHVRRGTSLIPLVQLTNALASLDDNNVLPMLRPTKGSGRAKANALGMALRALALHTVERLVAAGAQEKEAFDKVARAMTNAGLKKKRGPGEIEEQTLKHWRESADDDFEGEGTVAWALKEMRLNQKKLPPDTGDNASAIHEIMGTFKQMLKDFRGVDLD